MKIIRRTRWTLRLFSQIYECELPAHCRNPLELARRFFADRGAKHLKVEEQTLRFKRGSWLGSLFAISDLRVRHGCYAHLDRAGSSLVCEYSLISVLPNFTKPPWPLQREVEELESWIRRYAHSAPPAVANGCQPDATKGQSNRRFSNFLYRPLYRAYRVFSWVRYWSGRRFTKAGLVTATALCFAALLGLDPENSVAYQGFALLFGLLLVAGLFGFRFKGNFAAERLLPRFGTVGQPLVYRVVVRNLGRKPQLGLWVLEDLKDLRPSFEQWKALQLDDNKHIRPFRLNQRRRQNPYRLAKLKEAALPGLVSQQTGEASVELTPLRRGVVHFDGVTLARPDPLGIFRALRKVPLPQSVLILPKRYYIPPIALPGALKYQQGGVALASNIGQSDEFVSLREYRRGDPVRHIHWRSWAKAGKPIVKEFEDEFFVRHALILDTFTDRPQTEEFEEAVSVAASFACTVLTQESLLDLLFVGAQAYCFTAGRGLAHADQMLEILASVQPSLTLPFERLEELVLNHANLVSGCICVFLSWDQPRQRLVEALKAFGLPVLVLVVLNEKQTVPLDPGPLREEPERLVALQLGKIPQQLAQIG